MDVLVDADWLAARRAEVIVADVRWYLDGRSGRDAYEAGHLPGARLVDLDRDLSAGPGGTAGRHPLPTPEEFATAMARLGVGDDDRVVAYDDSGGGTAGRLVWMLRVTEPVDARAGHVPGARNAPWQSNLDPATGRFLPPAVLRERFVAPGVGDDAPVVAYCGSGVSACADLVALEQAGFGDRRLYVASWSGWSADPDRPIATGDT